MLISGVWGKAHILSTYSTTRSQSVCALFLLGPGDVVAVLVAAAAFAAVLHVFPVVLPLLAPLKLAIAHGTCFRGEILVAHGTRALVSESVVRAYGPGERACLSGGFLTRSSRPADFARFSRHFGRRADAGTRRTGTDAKKGPYLPVSYKRGQRQLPLAACPSGAIAQLVERWNRTPEVLGSNPSGSTPCSPPGRVMRDPRFCLQAGAGDCYV